MEIKTRRFSHISNIIFLFFTIFCIFFIWCNYYSKNFKISFWSSIIVVLTVLLIYLPIKNINLKTTKSSRSLKQNFDNFCIQLQFNKNSIIHNFIIKLFKISNCEIINNEHIIDKDNKIDYFLYLTEQISQQDIFNIYKNSMYYNIKLIVYNPLSTFIKIKGYNIEIYDNKKLFDISKHNNIKIENTVEFEKNKLSKKDIFNVIFSKSKSKNYLCIGLITLFSSLFTRFSIYYIIISTILFLLALYSRFNITFNNH